MTSEVDAWVANTLVALLVLVSIASVVTLWTLNGTSPSSQSVYAIYLAVDLVSFAMISYIYRATKLGNIHRAPLVAGCVFVVLLVCAGFVVF